jgi:Leucine-rich repeat (LRR) protein
LRVCGKLVNITISGHLKNLKELDISKNRLIRFFIPSTIDLHKLYLYDNNIVELPSFCQDDGISKVPNLRAMFLNRNALANLSPSMFDCLVV